MEITTKKLLQFFANHIKKLLDIAFLVAFGGVDELTVLAEQIGPGNGHIRKLRIHLTFRIRVNRERKTFELLV